MNALSGFLMPLFFVTISTVPRLPFIPNGVTAVNREAINNERHRHCMGFFVELSDTLQGFWPRMQVRVRHTAAGYL